MGLFDFFKSKNNPTQSKSKYEHLPLVNPQEDKQTPNGYVERKFIAEEKIYQSCDNIFRGSNIPIICNCEYATKYISTLVLQNPNGKKVRSVTEVIYYSVPDALKQDYVQLIAELNNIIIQHELPARYILSLDKIVFTSSPNNGTEIPVSRIQYNQDKNEFNFLFGNLMKENGPYKQSITIYKSTEYGCIIFSEDGSVKSATYTKPLKVIDAVFKFKNYKTGLDLYDIRYNGEVLFKRVK